MSTIIARGKKEWFRGWQRITLLPSAVHTEEADAAGDTFDLGDYDQMMVFLHITASATDAADTLDVYIDVSFDNTTWVNVAHFTQQDGNGAVPVKECAALNSAVAGVVASTTVVTSDATEGVVRPGITAQYVRARSTVVRDTGEDESHTFSVIAYVN